MKKKDIIRVRRARAAIGCLLLSSRLDSLAEEYEKKGNLKTAEALDRVNWQIRKAVEEEGLSEELEGASPDEILNQALGISEEQEELTKEQAEILELLSEVLGEEPEEEGEEEPEGEAAEEPEGEAEGGEAEGAELPGEEPWEGPENEEFPFAGSDRRLPRRRFTSKRPKRAYRVKNLR